MGEYKLIFKKIKRKEIVDKVELKVDIGSDETVTGKVVKICKFFGVKWKSLKEVSLNTYEVMI